MNYRRQLLYTGAALLLCLVVFSATPIDLWIQDMLYNAGSQQWLWPRHEPLMRFLLYDAIKAALILFVLCLVLILLGDRRGLLSPQTRHGLVLVIISMVLAPSIVSYLKWTTDIACPRSLAHYGGALPYDDLLSHLFGSFVYPHEQRCFPAGHASGGFALFSLMFLCTSGRGRMFALSFAFVVGWATGFYKMAIGDHFLSHTTVSMLLDWFVINLIGLIGQRWQGRRPLTTAESNPPAELSVQISAPR